MTIPQSVAEILKEHVTLEVEGIDRMYLNVYVPRLQIVEGVLGFIRRHRGYPVASTRMVEPITRQFVAAIEKFVRDHGIPLVAFEKGQRKEDVAAAHRADFSAAEGVVFVGKAQEKCTVYRTEKRRNPHTGKTYAWIVKSTALVNHYYFYCVDRDFGPFFLKFCSYFPYNAKLCLNGHEYVKRQLEQQGIAYQALDNGVLSCADPKRLQALCDGLSAAKIEALLRKWLRLLPHPFSARDRQAGYRYDLSILQIELSLTQVLDRPLTGRIFFEEVIRENLDIGRPKQVQLIFDRGVTKAHSRLVSHPRHHRRRRALPARRLQRNPHQAIPQRRPRPAHRDHHQQHLGLQHRQATSQPAAVATDRLPSQPAITGSRENQPRLHARRRGLPANPSPPPSGPATSFGPALRRSQGPILVPRLAGVSATPRRVLQPPSARPLRRPPRKTRRPPSPPDR